MVLAYVGHQHGIALGSFRYGVDHLTHEQWPFGGMDGRLNDLYALLLVEGLEGLAPLRVLGFLEQRRESREGLLAVGHDGHVSLHILIDLTLVDIQMNDLRLLGVSLEAARHAVAETHTDSDEDIALLLFQVDGVVTVHPEHSDIQRMCAGQGTKT